MKSVFLKVFKAIESFDLKNYKSVFFSKRIVIDVYKKEGIRIDELKKLK